MCMGVSYRFMGWVRIWQEVNLFGYLLLMALIIMIVIWYKSTKYHQLDQLEADSAAN